MGNGISPLRKAIANNDIGIARSILEEAGDGAPDLINEDYTSDCLFNPCVRSASSPVHKSMIQARMEIFELLLQHGGDPNATSNMEQTTLHRAARQNNLRATQLVVRYGADLYAQDEAGRYAPHLAALAILSSHSRNIDVLKFLLDGTYKPEDMNNLKDDDGNSVLHTAVLYGNYGAVTYLLEKGADRNVKNNHSKTPLELSPEACRSTMTGLFEQ